MRMFFSQAVESQVQASLNFERSMGCPLGLRSCDVLIYLLLFAPVGACAAKLAACEELDGHSCRISEWRKRLSAARPKDVPDVPDRNDEHRASRKKLLEEWRRRKREGNAGDEESECYFERAPVHSRSPL